MNALRGLRLAGWWWLLAALAIASAAYAPGLSGGFLFDDYPNIVDNPGVQPNDVSVGALVRAALSSPASEFKRPLASLSFALNYLVAGLDPYWMKLTNLLIHLLNGVLVFLLARSLLQATGSAAPGKRGALAAWIAAAWMLLPINLTAVLYVVQRMESMANVFVLLGLLGYIKGRRSMLARTADGDPQSRGIAEKGFLLCVGSLTVPTVIGLLAKETAVMLPLYAALIEWVVFDFRRSPLARDKRIVGLFVLVLVLPILAGLAWLLPGLLRSETWAARDFTLHTRLLSEARIVTDYVGWTLVPLPDELSFYHDNFKISEGLLSPWTTLACIAALAVMFAGAVWLRKRQPLISLGLLLFLGCHLLTGTVLPLELVYEHRNNFASFGLVLAVVPVLAALPRDRNPDPATPSYHSIRSAVFALPRRALLITLALWWASVTALTASAWGNPLHLAEELAARAPQSPRAQYELGRTYIIYSRYAPASPFTQLAYAPLERAAALPDSSILPQQALIFMNSRMHLPLKAVWWDSMVAKLGARKPGVQDESSLGALTQCARERFCDLPKAQMVRAFAAALSHPSPSARLLAIYGDYAWNVLDDRSLGVQLTREAVQAQSNEPAYRITLVRMLQAQGHAVEAREALVDLERLNIGGRLDSSLAQLRSLPGLQSPGPGRLN